MTPKAKNIVYWFTLLLMLSCILSGGIEESLRLKGDLDGMGALSYPPHWLTVLGFWKVLGSATLLALRFPRLKG